MGALQLFGLLSLASRVRGNLESPGLGKCMEVGHPLEDGTTAAVLVDCDNKPRQRVSFEDGQIMVYPGDHFDCLAADDDAANSRVRAADCDKTEPLQQWILTENGNIKLEGTELCLDVRALLKADGTRETWEEIQQRDAVALQVYDCHDMCTHRVNQLWTWSRTAGQASTQEEDLQAFGGHFVSPLLMKCMEVVHEGSSDEVHVESSSDLVHVDMVECGVSEHQRIQVDGSLIQHDDLCLTADSAEPNSDVHFKLCEHCLDCEAPKSRALQKWTLMEKGSIQLQGTALCLDVKAEQKADGSYENWEEIKAHKVNELHLYTCHDVSSDRVNQLWEWSPLGEKQMLAIKEGTRPDCQKTGAKVAPDDAPALVPSAELTLDPALHAALRHHHSPVNVVQGSMPDDTDEANALAENDILANFAIKQPQGKASLNMFGCAGVAAAAILLAGVYKGTLCRAQPQALLETCE